MDNNNAEKQDNSEAEAERNDLRPAHDPYPKMIIVCFLITIFFLFLVFFATLLDFAKREQQVEIKPKNPAFFEEFIKPAPKSNAK